MRIGLGIETDSLGGAETMLLGLARELLERGHHVVGLGRVGGEGWLTARLGELGIERERVPASGPAGIGGVPRLARAIERHALDVVHSHDFGMAVAGALGSRLAGCRHVITMHGGQYYASSPARRLALRVAVGLSHRTVAVSRDLQNTLAASLGLRLREVEVIHNGVADVRASGSRVREGLGIRSDDFLILAVGNLLPVKGHSTLLRAAARLASGGHRVVVAIAGRGPEEANLRDEAERLGISDDVLLLGHRSDVADLLVNADVFAMPSLSEGLPMAVIEAMLSGTPIVASDAGGIRELLDTPEVGVLVRAGDPADLAARLSDLIHDPARRERLGSAGRARALKHFSAAAMASAYVSMYSEDTR